MMERLSSVKNAFSSTTSTPATAGLTNMPTSNTAIKPVTMVAKKEMLLPLSRQARVGSSASGSSMDSTLTASSSMQQLYSSAGNNRKSYPNSDISASFSSSVAGSIQVSALFLFLFSLPFYILFCIYIYIKYGFYMHKLFPLSFYRPLIFQFINN